MTTRSRHGTHHLWSDNLSSFGIGVQTPLLCAHAFRTSWRRGNGAGSLYGTVSGGYVVGLGSSRPLGRCGGSFQLVYQLSRRHLAQDCYRFPTSSSCALRPLYRSWNLKR